MGWGPWGCMSSCFSSSNGIECKFRTKNGRTFRHPQPSKNFEPWASVNQPVSHKCFLFKCKTDLDEQALCLQIRRAWPLRGPGPLVLRGSPGLSTLQTWGSPLSKPGGIPQLPYTASLPQIALETAHRSQFPGSIGTVEFRHFVHLLQEVNFQNFILMPSDEMRDNILHLPAIGAHKLPSQGPKSDFLNSGCNGN